MVTSDPGRVVSTGPTLTSWHSPVSTIQPGLQGGFRAEPLCVHRGSARWGWGVREGGKKRITKGCEGLMEVMDPVTIWIVVMKSLVVTH